MRIPAESISNGPRITALNGGHFFRELRRDVDESILLALAVHVEVSVCIGFQELNQEWLFYTIAFPTRCTILVETDVHDQFHALSCQRSLSLDSYLR